MKTKNHILQCVFAFFLLSACKQKYEPPAIKADLGYLVVDGFINNSADTTFIQVSHTNKLDSGVQNSGELNAQLSIEDINSNVVYNFQLFDNTGKYFIPGINLDANNKYRLRINIANGKQYLSDELAVIKTPPIDSVSWSRDDKGVTIYANTHDPQNNTKYYRWEYTETWKYRAAFASTLKYENGALMDRPLDEYIWECWKTNQSYALLLASSAKLSEDIISKNPIRFIPINSSELTILYSILLKQYAMTKESFEYTQNLKKITEQTGSIFDAQPSQLTGNIHAINNTNEPVLGFMTISTAEIKRIFISNDEVLPWLQPTVCFQIEVKPPVTDTIKVYFGQLGYIPLSYDGYGPGLKGIYATTPHCADCRFGGGVTTKPDFWP